MPADFTINFICHGDFELLEKTIPQNLKALCNNTDQTYDVIMTVDGIESLDPHCYLNSAPKWGIDEVRFRWRKNNCAIGDPSNNGHLHTFCDRTPYLLTLEGDIVIFQDNRDFDILSGFRKLFERHERLAVASRMDDHDTWVWKLEDVASPFEPGIRSVNRVASHFLVYQTNRARKVMSREPILKTDSFYDNGERWFNYEDFISTKFAEPEGPGIAYIEKFPIKVYHCDVKVTKDSVFYSKDIDVKLREFKRRLTEEEHERK